MAGRLQYIEFLGSGNTGGVTTWTCPTGVFRIWLWGYGGGGGGGGGRGGATSNTTFSSPGGGGGGGAIPPPAPILVRVTPGTTYTITVGAAGIGGTNGSGNAGYGTSGGPGGDTIFSGGGLNIRFAGAHGGVADYNALQNPPGGGTVHPEVADANAYDPVVQQSDSDLSLVVSPSGGGFGAKGTGTTGTAVAWPGMRAHVQRRTSDNGTVTRSSGGSNGANGTGYGGGGGGGGGNGPGGIGGNGGNGGASGASGSNGSGASDGTAANNTGAGGGGGGGAGYNGLAGGTGGTGGSGKLVINYLL